MRGRESRAVCLLRVESFLARGYHPTNHPRGLGLVDQSIMEVLWIWQHAVGGGGLNIVGNGSCRGTERGPDGSPGAVAHAT